MFHIYANGTEIYYPLDENMQLLSPRLTLEIGKAGALEFSIPTSNSYYDRLQQLSTIITVDMDDQEIFRGRVLSNTRGFDNTRKIYIEGDLAYLVDSVQKGEKYSGTTHALFRNIIAAHNSRVDASKRFTVGTIGIEDRDIVLYGQSDDVEDMETGAIDYRQIVLNSTADEWLTTYDYIDSALIDYCGGYLRTRKIGDTVYIDLVTDYGNRALQEIEFGKNILDLTEEVSAEELFTVLIPLGDENLTIESVNNGSDELVDETAVAKYGRIVRTHVFGSVNQPSTLLENGRRYLASNANVPITISVKAVDMHFVDKSVSFINVGDQVHVNSLPHNIYEYLTCTKIEYDLANPSNNVYTFGNPKQSLTERYRKDRKIEKESRSSSKSGGGAAAGTADKKAEKDLSDFFDAWINVNPNSAHIDLGTLYKQVEDGKEVLKRECGIDVDGVTGNINIRSFKQQYDKTERKTNENEAKIEVLTQDTKSQINLVTRRINDVSDREKQHYAEIKIWADDTESQINLKADKVTVDALRVSLNTTDQKINKTNDVLTRQCGIDLNAKTGNINIKSLYAKVDKNGKEIKNNSTRITQSANDLQAKISINAQSISDHENKIAAIELKANDQESSIKLKADKTTVEGEFETVKADIDSLKTSVADINKLFAETLNAYKIEADTIHASTIQIGYGDNNYAITGAGLTSILKLYASKNHTHDIYAGKYHTHSQYALKSHSHTR